MTLPIPLLMTKFDLQLFYLCRVYCIYTKSNKTWHLLMFQEEIYLIGVLFKVFQLYIMLPGDSCVVVVVLVYQGDTKVAKPVAYLKRGQTFGVSYM